MMKSVMKQSRVKSNGMGIHHRAEKPIKSITTLKSKVSSSSSPSTSTLTTAATTFTSTSTRTTTGSFWPSFFLIAFIHLLNSFLLSTSVTAVSSPSLINSMKLKSLASKFPSGHMFNEMKDEQDLQRLTGYHGNVTKAKRTYVELRCRGMYDQRILRRLENICEDCYNLYKDPEVHGFCRIDCFSSNTFRQCMQSLLLDEQRNSILEMVEIIGKKRKRKRRRRKR